MSHQFCPIHPYHLTSISKLKAWITPGFFLARGTHTLPIPLYHTFLVMSNFSMRFYIFGIIFRNFGRNLFYKKKFDFGKNLRVSHFPYPKEPPKHPLYGAESKNFRGLLHLGHTFTTHILFTFRTYIYKLHL